MEGELATESKTETHMVLDDKKILGLLPVILLAVIVIIRVSFVLCKSSGHKTRTPQQRRMYVGNQSRPSSMSPEPTIYVSPANYPPPPKYEQMAPPSYEEVVGIHYPQYQNQPITAPITAAVAQSSNTTDNPVTAESTVITVTSGERRTSVTVRS